MAVYFVVQIDIEDRGRYGQYEAGFMEIFGHHGGKVLSVDEDPILLEGTWPHTRTVLLEFPDAHAARTWYDSPAYQQLARHRFAASTSNAVMIQGLE
ncbi:MAG: DUF1330 domain-containing protein [Pseudomonadales bacterium]|jgi:uncharacterized protein (DUF1330 family)|nr:DUF1330 domain-containing protein [Pseudomonadales bacterium]MDP6470444.1 DUF1330 domain-containing protein [Pseudomonadales bacterium]MDP6827745.1 DUF1330 domain-containing protein [Pseudomonadales bacterium]MDP6973388.1 DUF1330 domain-containing protein [Pseudomonadales bacterium]